MHVDLTRTPHFTVHGVHPKPCSCSHVARWMSFNALLYVSPVRVERKRKRDEGLSRFHVVVDLTKDEVAKESDWKVKRAKWWEMSVGYLAPAPRLVGIELNPGPTWQDELAKATERVREREADRETAEKIKSEASKDAEQRKQGRAVCLLGAACMNTRIAHQQMFIHYMNW